MKPLRILAISGSTRENSSNEILLNLIAKHFKQTADVEIFKDLALLPHFNPDADPQSIPVVKTFINKIERANGVFICSPEYVFSLPGSLNNALEWTVSGVSFSYKPVGFIVAASSGLKAFESLELIMQTLVQAPIPENCKLLIQGGKDKIKSNGTFTNADTPSEIIDVFKNVLLSITDKSSQTINF